jgi:hypothetical protein
VAARRIPQKSDRSKQGRSFGFSIVATLPACEGTKGSGQGCQRSEASKASI